MQSQRILVVQSSRESNLLVGAILKNGLNWEIGQVKTVSEAIQAMQRGFVPQLILTGLGLAGKRTGFDLLKIIRKHDSWKNITVIAYTAYVTPSIKQACQQAGFDMFLEKPLTSAELREYIQNLS